jgi:hypothetical protein
MIALEYGNVQVPSDFITAWIVMAFAGFLQWFILVPRFLQKPDLILLKLEHPQRYRRLVLRTRRCLRVK